MKSTAYTFSRDNIQDSTNQTISSTSEDKFEIKKVETSNVLVFLYGLAGSGKTHLGKLLKKQFGFYFWDGDNAITERMVNSIKENKSFDQSMRDEFTSELIEKVKYLQTIVNEKPIVISQALYKSSNRQTLMSTFPNAQFIHVNASDEVLLKRLRLRQEVDVEYLAKKIRANFELPTVLEQERTMTIINDSNDEEYTITALKKLLLISTIEHKESPIVTGSPIDIYINTEVSESLKRELFLQANKFSFVRIIEDKSSHEIDKKDENILRVCIEQYTAPNSDQPTSSKISDWITNNILMQDYELKILLCKNKAFFYSTNNKIKEVNLDNDSLAAKYIIGNAVGNRTRILLRNRDIISVRGKASGINQFYQKFFNLDVKYYKETSGITTSTHLIKTFDENRRFLRTNTYISGRLFKQKSSEILPTIMFFPGTAYARMLGETIDKESYKIAATTGCNVFTVHYRLSPENIFPTPLLDAYVTYKFLLKNATSLGINHDKLIISGYSSGASLALQFGYVITKSNLLPKPISLALICPTTDFSYLMPEYKDTIGTCDRFLKIDFFRTMHTIYLSQFQNLKNPAISPLYMEEKDIKALPKVFMFHVQRDVFISQHKNFTQKLVSNGCSTEIPKFQELDHCSWWDNQLQWEAFANWINKDYGVKNLTLSKSIVTTNKRFFESEIFNFKVTKKLPFSPMEPELKETIDLIYLNLLLKRNDSTNILKLADQFPTNITLQLYAAMYLTVTNKDKLSDVIKYFDRLTTLKTSACEREQILAEAILFTKTNSIEKAIECYSNVVRKWPEDILSGLMVEFHCNQIGEPEKLLTLWDSIKEHYIKDNRIKDLPLASIFLAKYAYALGAVNNAEKALHVAGQALALNPFNHYAQCIIADICLKINDASTGIAILRKYQHIWNLNGDEVKTENHYHLTVSYLQKHDFRNAYKNYEKHIKKETPFLQYQQVNMINLLWRFDMIDAPSMLRMKIQREWHSLYKFIRENDLVMANLEGSNPFTHLMYLYLYIRNDDNDGIELIKNKISSMDGKNWQTAAQIAESLILYSNNELGAARKMIKNVFDKPSIGGSEAQRLVLTETYDTICKKHDRKVTEQTKRAKILKYGLLAGCAAGLFYNVCRAVTKPSDSKTFTP